MVTTFYVDAAWANDDGEFDAVYEFGESLADVHHDLVGDAASIGKAVTEYLTSLSAEGLKRMLEYGEGIHIVLKIWPKLNNKT